MTEKGRNNQRISKLVNGEVGGNSPQALGEYDEKGTNNE